MPTRKTNSRIKNRDQYEALRKQGMSKEKAARITNSGREASVKGGKKSKYEDWTKKELIDQAREVRIQNYSKLNKEKLINALRNN